MTTSDGRAYIVRWAPPAPSHDAATPLYTPAGASTASLLSPLSPTDESGPNLAANRWTWTGLCFHPAAPGGRGSEEWVAAQEKELDKGKGASAVDLNEQMGLVTVGCEECVPPCSCSSLAC